MNGLRIVSSADTATIQEIVGETNRMLAETNVPEKKLGEIGTSNLCLQASDAATRAAHSLGFVASRELHLHGAHALTSFAPLDQLPSEDDLVLDMTWGQFNAAGYAKAPFNEFFGLRRDLAGYVGDFYGSWHSASSVNYRQIVHTPPAKFPGAHLWLRTTPEDVATGQYTIGEVDSEKFAQMQQSLAQPV